MTFLAVEQGYKFMFCKLRNSCLLFNSKYIQGQRVISKNCILLNKKSDDWRKMVDPRRVVSYEDMLKVINQAQKVIIDVRNPEEVKTTGKIPSSINIPLYDVEDALQYMTDEEFMKNYCRNKPNPCDELIFYCQSGRRSTEALDKALELGYSNSKTYLGSWNDWKTRQN